MNWYESATLPVTLAWKGAKDSNDIKKFIDGQLERAKVLGNDSPVGKLKNSILTIKKNF